MDIHKHFTDEAIIKPEGVPIEYVRPTFEHPAVGLETSEATWEEFVAARESAKKV